MTVVSLLTRAKLQVLARNLATFLPGANQSIASTHDLYTAIENLRIALVVVHGVAGTVTQFGFGLTQLNAHFQELEDAANYTTTMLGYLFVEAAKAVEDMVHRFSVDRCETIPSFHPQGPIRPTLQQVMLGGIPVGAQPFASSATTSPAGMGGGGKHGNENPARHDHTMGTTSTGPTCRVWRNMLKDGQAKGKTTCGRMFNGTPCIYQHPRPGASSAART